MSGSQPRPVRFRVRELTCVTIVNSLYDLAPEPETVEALRDEVRRVLAANGGVMTTKALFDMKLMDSVMRESQRLNPPFSGTSRQAPVLAVL